MYYVNKKNCEKLHINSIKYNVKRMNILTGFLPFNPYTKRTLLAFLSNVHRILHMKLHVIALNIE